MDKFTTAILDILKNPNWWVAFGTTASAFFAVYLAFFGNRQTRLMMKENEKALDRQAFDFITMIPSTITSHIDAQATYGTSTLTCREFISNFERAVQEKGILHDRSLRRYRNYASLANQFSKCTGVKDSDLRKQKQLLNLIIKKANKLSKVMDSHTKLNGLQKLWDYDDMLFWNRRVYIAKTLNTGTLKHFIYTDVNSGDSIKSENEAIKIICKHYNKNYRYDNYIYHIGDDEFLCKHLRPNDFELIKRTKYFIKFNYVGNLIRLKYNKPFTLM